MKELSTLEKKKLYSYAMIKLSKGYNYLILYEQGNLPMMEFAKTYDEAQELYRRVIRRTYYIRIAIANLNKMEVILCQ